MTRAACVTVLLVLCAACSSKPDHFDVLTPVAGARAAQSPPFPLQVAAFHIPPVLDRPEMVRRDSANGLKLDEHERWGASLGEMARNVLAEDLRRRLPPGAVVLPNAPTPPGAAALIVDITQFDESPDGQVKLAGSWTLMRGNPSAPVLTRDIALSKQSGGDAAAAQAATMSALLAELTGAIARELSTSALQ